MPEPTEFQKVFASTFGQKLAEIFANCIGFAFALFLVLIFIRVNPEIQKLVSFEGQGFKFSLQTAKNSEEAANLIKILQGRQEDIQGQINQIKQVIQKQHDSIPLAPIPAAIASEEAVKANEIAVNASRIVQKLESQDTQSQANSIVGTIWIGNMKSGDSSEFEQSSLNIKGKNKIVKLEDLIINSEITALENLRIREDYPNDDASYFNGKRMVGVLTTGQKCTIEGPPRLYEAGIKRQCWIKIRIQAQ